MTNGSATENYGRSFSVDNEFKFTTGIHTVDYHKYSIVFPANASSNESHMTVSEYFSNQSMITYVGIRIEHDLANRLFPVNTRYTNFYYGSISVLGKNIV